jgi:hypothetical protein
MAIIEFSHTYLKMPLDVSNLRTYLIGISVCDISDLPKNFIDYDTGYIEKDSLKHYKLPKGKVIILSLFTVRLYAPNQVWTTIRSWNPSKESYYQKLIGEEIGIVVEGDGGKYETV